MLKQQSRGGVCPGVGIALIVAAVLALVPGQAMADTAEEVRETIIKDMEYANKNLKDAPGTVSKDGSAEFWSSGGLMQWVPADGELSEYEYQTLTPKHIEVMTLAEGEAAVAMFYVEGRFKAKGGTAVDNYLTRATQVYVKEDGRWKVRAAHWSPIAGGSGTNQNSLD
jgi:hypothetical protein